MPSTHPRRATPSPHASTSGRYRSLAAIGFLALAINGCTTVGPNYVEPGMTAPGAYTADLARGLSDGPTDLGRWWERLGDPTLSDLIRRGLDANLDLRAALSRIQEARALRGIAGTQLYPTIDATGSFSRSQSSGENFVGTGSPLRGNQHAIGLEASWELDVWGGLRRSIEASQGELEATVEDARDVMVSVIAEIALSYTDLRTSQERLRIARANVTLQQQTLDLTRDQFNADLVGMLDVEQARSSLHATRAIVPSLQAAARAARNRLAVLLGVSPGALETELDLPQAIPVPPDAVAVGVPADLVRRRPDIRSAERSLAAQTARIGVAEADLYPRFMLSGTLGYEAERARDLFSSDASTFGIAPSVRFNLFDRSRIRNAITVEDARTEQALASYEKTVLLALEETENAMTRFVRDQQSRDEYAIAAEAARSAIELSRAQYRQGLAGFQSVIDTQSRLFQLEDTLAVTSGDVTRDLISLYRSLGGGWEDHDIVMRQIGESE